MLRCENEDLDGQKVIGSSVFKGKCRCCFLFLLIKSEQFFQCNLNTKRERLFVGL